MRFLILPLLSVCLFLAVGADTSSSGPIEFRTHVIESNIPGGYSVIVTDINNDKRPDVIGMTAKLTELAWYENPGWERHVMIKDMTGMVNLAAYDIDGDGIPELAIQNEFSMVASKSPGLVWLLQHQGDPKGLWKATKIDQVITSHHVAWADVDGDGKKELINAPLIGPKGLAPTYDQDNVSLFYYRTPKDLEGEWKRLLIDDQLKGVLHRARVVKWNNGPREQILTAGFDGIVLHEATGTGDKIHWKNTLLSKGHEEAPPRAGTSDVAMGRLHANRMLAAVEPWHGNEVVVYTQAKSGAWQRKVIFSELKEGHEVCVGDFNGDGRDDIVAGDRAKGEISSSHIFYAQDDEGKEWHHEILDPMGMSASGCQVKDINQDGRPDIVMIGGATHNIKWYENLGTKPGRQH
ncbi:MAG: FG-GAP repeat domain-containing protein [Bryobacteraceae bacterium]